MSSKISDKFRNDWILFVFISYVILIIVFAICYYTVFKISPSSFVFNSDIRYSQSITFKTNTEKEIGESQHQIMVLRELSETLSTKAEFDSVTSPLYPIYRSFVFGKTSKFEFSDNGELKKTKKRIPIWLSVYDSSGRMVLHISVGFYLLQRNSSKVLLSIDVFREGIPKLIKNIETSIFESQRKLETLQTSTPEVWTFLDFLYFSTTTQTSANYGDMLPNSTKVRMLVVLQILSGVFILAFALNFVFVAPKYKKDK